MASISCPSPARLRDGPDLSPSLFPNPPSPLLASPETAIHRQRRPCYSPTVSSSSPSTSSSSASFSAASSVLSSWSPASTSAPSTSTSSASLASSSFAEKRLWSEEFRVLESDFQKFSSRTTVHKANVLRLSLLPFLRSHVGESTSVSPVELDRRLHILHKWWSAALAALRDRSSPRAVAAADRAAYFEAIFGILSRHEWRLASSHSTRDLYLVSLSDSLKLALDRLMMKPVPVSVSVFAGAVIAHAFFYLPGVAPALLYLFQVRHADVSRVQKQCGLSPFVGANLKRSAISVFPSHLAPLIVCHAPPTSRPPLPQDLSDYLYGAWAQRWWTRQDSDVFASFFKHYYIIASDYIALTSTAADITPDEAIISTPGILIIHASILRIIDGVVHCNSPSNSTPSTSSSIKRSASLPSGKADPNALPTEVNATIRTTVSSSVLARQLYQMRILLAIKEVLDLSGPTCTAYASTFLRFFESTILHAAAKHTSLYDAEACVVLCDLAEAVLTTLAGATRSDHVNWSFWFDIMKQLVASESSMTEVRALSFLYSFWDNIAADSDYAAVDWVLGPAVWRKFFCHWAPLVRSYYMRLICWRVIRPASPQSRDAVDRVVDRLSSLYMALRRLAASGRPIDVTPCSPVPGRRMALVMCSGRDTAAHKFFLLSMRFRQEILSAVEFENGDRSKSKGVANRYDVHDEEVFIAAATMMPSSGPSSLSASSASLPLSASSYSAPAASTSASASAAKGIASVFRRFRSFKSGSTTTTTESTTTQVQQQTSVSSVSVSEQTFKSTRLRRTPSTSSTNSTSSVITSASALTMSGQTSNGFASAPGSSSTVNSLLGSEKSYCFMLQPTDAHRLQRTPATSNASTPTPSASSSSTSLPLQANNSQSQLLLPRGAQIPVPRLPFARHSVMAMASQRKGASGFAAAAERKLVVATPPESGSSSFVSALRDIANSPATAAAAAVVVAQNSPVPSSIATFELQPFASSSSSTSSGSNLTTSSTSLSSLTTGLSPHSSSSSGNGNDSTNTNTTSSSTSGTLPSISPHGNSLKYAGHALSEWNSVVRQYERFVEMRRKKDGIDLDLDIGTPSIIGEVLC